MTRRSPLSAVAAPLPRRAVAVSLALVLGGAFVSASVAFAGTPRGPNFGTTKYRTSLVTVANTPDVDDYVAPMIAGESLSVTVTADKGSLVLPQVVVLDPSGNDVTPTLKSPKSGKLVSFKGLAIGTTGRWTVRISGRDGTQGAYTVRFQTKAAKSVRFTKQALGGAGEEPQLEREHAFEAIEGAHATFLLKERGKGADVRVTGLSEPTGSPVLVPSPAEKGASKKYTDLLLPLSNGTYRVSVGIDEGAAAYDLSVAVTTPDRPKGTIDLDPQELRLSAILQPREGNAKTVFRLNGSGFKSNPAPKVFVGGRKATVLATSLTGNYLDLALPDFPEGTLVEVAVQNPDGQADVRDDYLLYNAPPTPTMKTLTPGTTSVYAGAAKTFTVALDRAAPVGGVTVNLATTGAIGTVPASVTISSGQSFGTFDFAAGGNVTTGQVTASFGGVNLSADVSVVALPGGGGGGGGGGDPPPPLPDEIDLSGWSIVQAVSSRTYSLPSGTKLKQGEYLVIGRISSSAAFQTYWGVTFGSNVVYLSGEMAPADSGDDWPTINGDETYELRNASGVVVDGVTIAMQAGGGASYARTAGAPAGQSTSWTKAATTVGTPTPGSGQGTSTTKHGVYISEFSDASGSGNFVYEFVELHFDGLLGQ